MRTSVILQLVVTLPLPGFSPFDALHLSTLKTIIILATQHRATFINIIRSAKYFRCWIKTSSMPSCASEIKTEFEFNKKKMPGDFYLQVD